MTYACTPASRNVLSKRRPATGPAGGLAGTSGARRPYRRPTRRRRGRGRRRRLAVELQGEADRGAGGRRREDQVEVAHLEAVAERTAPGLEPGGLLAHRPRPGERPLVEREPVGAAVAAALTAGV